MSAEPVAPPLLSAEQFFELPEPENGSGLELVRGEVVCDMVTGGDHGDYILAIGEVIRPFVRKARLGRVTTDAGIVLASNPATVRAPDLAFVPTERLNQQGRLGEGLVRAVPTLAVEVVSPNDLDRDVSAKVDDYLAAGVERIWVVRPKQRTVTVYREGGTARIVAGESVLTSEDAGFAVEGFELSLASLFD